MADKPKTIPELPSASGISDADYTIVEQSVSDSSATNKATVGQVGSHIANLMEFNSLATTSKTLIGAINEAAQSGGATELNELSDVTLPSSIVPGAVLQYQPTGPDTGTWTSSGYSPAFYMTQLRDVNIDDDYLDTKPFLMYDWDEDEWINTALSISMIGDIAINPSSTGTNQTLMYDGGSGKWENHDIYLGSLSGNSNLKDVVMGGTTIEGDTLRYNAATNKWENAQMYYDVTGTLTVGNTQLILLYTQGSNIPLSTATVEVFTDTYGVNPTNVSIVGNNITLTFAAQANNVGVKVRVWR